MNTTNQMLAGLLVVQLLLALGTWSSHGDSVETGTRPLLPLELSSITGLTVEAKPLAADKEARSVRLVRDGETWKVASAGDFPADKAKVEEALKKILDIRIRDPIARSKASHNALHVGASEYDKKIAIRVGDKVHDLVLGSAKGSSSNVRLSSSDDVFWAKGVSSWSVGDDVSSYVDTQYISLDEPTKVSVTNQHGSFVLEKAADGAWKLAGLPGTVDKGKVDSFVSSVAKVRLTEPVGKDVRAEHGLTSGARVELADKDGKTIRYAIGTLEDDKYYVKADDREHVVRVSKWSLEKVLDQKPTDLLAQAAGG